jgi:hypothetical protein
VTARRLVATVVVVVLCVGLALGAVWVALQGRYWVAFGLLIAARMVVAFVERYSEKAASE